ncbi:MAG TPA: DUF1428 domain-containing protein [Noviherbaspirillum sp.]|jgi:uncharacterized protein YbaA (DUF1428 family)|uniref:DUF1428 domain-containing protein n=1 Tax=Noviherbaspirillum sp. TaxID=1926288 RepID=UPI002F92F43D
MTYIDCYLVPVPRKNKAAYEELARISESVVKEHGALRVVECWLDESGPDVTTYHGADARLEPERYATFRRAAGASDQEAVVMSFVEWPNKDARDRGMERVTRDPRMQFAGLPPVFEGARLIAGGFLPMLDSRREA